MVQLVSVIFCALFFSLSLSFVSISIIFLLILFHIHRFPFLFIHAVWRKTQFTLRRVRALTEARARMGKKVFIAKGEGEIDDDDEIICQFQTPLFHATILILWLFEARICKKSDC